jgi:predicted dehydrogenase
MEKLGIGFIGSGFVAGFHAAGFTGVRDAEINAIYNYQEESAKRLSSKVKDLRVGDPKTYTDLHEMLADPSVDAVWILNPNFKRVETVEAIAEEAIQGRTDLVGVCCEKPLARTADEAEKIVTLIEKAGLLHGYLENQVYAPTVSRGKEVVWQQAAKYTGRPYLARAAEEHGGPHVAWFWNPKLSGGGVLLDMTCHSIEAARYMLTNPEQPKEALKPVSVQSTISSLKWTKEPHVTHLKEEYSVDYSESPAEDYALTLIEYQDEDGARALTEARTSWSYTGPGLRLTFEVLGPEYSLSINSLQQELNIFLSRGVNIPASEEFVEKQAAEQGLMPVIPNEAIAYGYQDEDRHMVEAFRAGEPPSETWRDGLLVSQLMMTAYLSAEKNTKLCFDPNAVRGYTPKVAKGEWRP